MNPLPIDLDSEAIQYDGHWYTRDDLARRIKAMLDAGDFAVGRPSLALEQLTVVLASLRTLAFRATPDVADAINQAAAKQGRSVGGVIRQALADYLGMPSPHEADRGGKSTAPSASGRKQTEPEMPAVALAGPAPTTAPELRAQPMAQQSLPPQQVLAGPGALKAAAPVPLPSVMVERSAIVTEPATADEAAGAVNLTAKKKEDEAVERRWFGG